MTDAEFRIGTISGTLLPWWQKLGHTLSEATRGDTPKRQETLLRDMESACRDILAAHALDLEEAGRDGHDSAQEYGHELGFSDGRRSATEEAYENGKKAGITEGYAKGLDAGKAQHLVDGILETATA